ncbi:MAG: hypothetical protein IKV89_00620 [Clostridia bacterium]|nr:hypothetical protein [Clostridia bacterium]
MKKLNLKENLISFVFIAFMLAFTVLFIVVPKECFSIKEKRNLEKFPQFSKEALLDGSYTEGIESYLADHTPLRNLFVGINSYYSLFTGNNGANGVYLGSDGYLIEKPVDDFDNANTNARKIANFAKKTDVPITFALAPSKGFVYGEKLPKNHLDYLDNDYYQMISQAVGDKVQFIDLSKTLMSNKGDKQLYYKTDHHWTTYSAYLAYQQICDAMNLNATPESAFEKEYIEGFYGTSYASSGYWLTDSDTIEVWYNKNLDGITVEIDDGVGTEVHSTMFFSEQFASYDKYNGFLNGNHAVVKIKNTASKGGKLLVIKDSFAHCLVPFLAENYSEIVMVDLRYYRRAITDLITENEIDEVLFMYSIDNFAESTDIVLR